MSTPHFDFETFSKNLNDHRFAEQARIGKNLSFQDIANQTEISGKSIIFKAFQGNHVSLESAVKLCHWMGKTLDDFVKREDNGQA